MFVYILGSTLWLTLFVVAYRWQFRRRTDEPTRSAYLLLACLFGLLVPALPESHQLWTLPELRSADEPLPVWRFTLFDAVLVVYYLGAAAFLLRAADRARRLWGWFRATPPLHSEHYAFVDPPGVRPADLLHVLFYQSEEPAAALRVATHYEQHRLRRTDWAQLALWELLRALCWVQPWTHWLHAERTRLARRSVNRYLRAKTQRLEGFLNASSSVPLRFDWVLPGRIAPPRPDLHPQPRLLLAGWLASLLLFGLSVETISERGLLPGTTVLTEADRVLRLMGRTPIYVQKTDPGPQEAFIFYWGSWLTVHLAPERDPPPHDAPAEPQPFVRHFITKEKLLESLRDEPLLATETGPLFNRLEFDLNYWDSTGWTMCHVLADAALPAAYRENACLTRFMERVQPGNMVQFRNIRHGYPDIPNNVPDFTIFLNTEYDWRGPAPRDHWRSRSFEWREFSGHFTFHPLNGHWTADPLEIPRDRLRELVRSGFLAWAYNIDVQLDRIIEHAGRRLRGDFFEQWEPDNLVWQYIASGDRVRITFQDDSGRDYVLEILVQ